MPKIDWNALEEFAHKEAKRVGLIKKKKRPKRRIIARSNIAQDVPDDLAREISNQGMVQIRR